MNFVGTNIFGKTLGLVGAGRIGEVAHYAKALGLEVLYTDERRNERLETLYVGNLGGEAFDLPFRIGFAELAFCDREFEILFCVVLRVERGISRMIRFAGGSTK